MAITLTSRMLPRRPDLWIAWRERKLSCGCSKLGKLKLASRSIFEGWLARAAGSGIRSRSDEDEAQIQAEMVENSSRSAELRMKKLRNTNMQRVELVLAEIGSSWLNRRSSGVEPLQCLPLFIQLLVILCSGCTQMGSLKTCGSELIGFDVHNGVDLPRVQHVYVDTVWLRQQYTCLPSFHLCLFERPTVVVPY